MARRRSGSVVVGRAAGLLVLSAVLVGCSSGDSAPVAEAPQSASSTTAATEPATTTTVAPTSSSLETSTTAGETTSTPSLPAANLDELIIVSIRDIDDFIISDTVYFDEDGGATEVPEETVLEFEATIRSVVVEYIEADSTHGPEGLSMFVTERSDRKAPTQLYFKAFWYDGVEFAPELIDLVNDVATFHIPFDPARVEDRGYIATSVGNSITQLVGAYEAAGVEPVNS